jgi:hypothetical protein
LGSIFDISKDSASLSTGPIYTSYVTVGQGLGAATEVQPEFACRLTEPGI